MGKGIKETERPGVEDIFIACMDGPTGFPEAVHAVFLSTWIQMCIVPMIRHSTKYVSYKDLKKVCADLQAILGGADDEAAVRDTLESLGRTWDSKYPMIYPSWGDHWNDRCEYCNYSPEIRRIIYD